MLYDIHCHLYMLDDVDNVIERAIDAGLILILTNGTDRESNEQCIALAENYDLVQAALGLYPTDAIKLSEEDIAAVIEQIRNNNPIAIGEVGLDYHWDDSKKDEMKTIFSKMLDLAEELGKPVIIHSRKAERDVIEMLEARPSFKACLHCFGGSLKLAKRAAKLGCYFSIPVNITKSTHFQRLVEETPIELLLTETDSPYLSLDDAQNEPCNVVFSLEKIAELKGLDVESCKSLLNNNLKQFLTN